MEIFSSIHHFEAQNLRNNMVASDFRSNFIFLHDPRKNTVRCVVVGFCCKSTPYLFFFFPFALCVPRDLLLRLFPRSTRRIIILASVVEIHLVPAALLSIPSIFSFSPRDFSSSVHFFPIGTVPCIFSRGKRNGCRRSLSRPSK